MKRTQNLLILCQFLMMLSLEMSNPFLPSYINTLSHARLAQVAMQSSIIMAIPMLMMIITSPIWGSLADKYGYKPMLLRASGALIITQLLTGLANTPEQLIIIRLFQGGFAGFIAAMQAYAVNLSHWESKGKNLARLQSAKALGTSISGIIGGIIIHLTNMNYLFFISSFLCAIVTVIMFLYLPPVNKKPINTLQKPQPSWSIHFSVITALITLSQIAKFIPNPTFSIYVETLINADPITIGILYSIPAISLILTSEFSGRVFDFIRNNKPHLISMYFSIVALLGGLVMILHAYANSVIALIPIRFLWGVVFASLLPALFALISDHSNKSGYYIGLANSFAKLGNLSGLIIGGYAAGFMPLNQLFLLTAFSYFLIMSMSLFQSKKESQWSKS